MPGAQVVVDELAADTGYGLLAGRIDIGQDNLVEQRQADRQSRGRSRVYVYRGGAGKWQDYFLVSVELAYGT